VLLFHTFPEPLRIALLTGPGHHFGGGGQRPGHGLQQQGKLQTLQQRHLISTPNRGPVHASPAAYRDNPAGSMTWEGNAQLDSTVNRNKNLKDAFVVQSWLIKSSQVLEKFKLDPLPDSYLHDSHSETGTDYSNAPTSEYDRVSLPRFVFPHQCLIAPIAQSALSRHCPKCALACLHWIGLKILCIKILFIQDVVYRDDVYYRCCASRMLYIRDVDY